MTDLNLPRNVKFTAKRRRRLAPRAFRRAWAQARMGPVSQRTVSEERAEDRRQKRPDVEGPRTFSFAKTFIKTQAARKPGQQMCTSTRADG